MKNKHYLIKLSCEVRKGEKLSLDIRLHVLRTNILRQSTHSFSHGWCQNKRSNDYSALLVLLDILSKRKARYYKNAWNTEKEIQIT